MSSAARSTTSASGSAPPSSRAERDGLDHDALGAAPGGARSAAVGELVPGEDQLRLGVAEVERDLALLEQHVHRHDDAAGAQHAVVGDRELGHVREHHPDAVAGLEAALDAAAPATRAVAVVELRVGDHGVVEAQRRRIRVPLPRSRSGCRRGSRSSSVLLVGGRMREKLAEPAALRTWEPRALNRAGAIVRAPNQMLAPGRRPGGPRSGSRSGRSRGAGRNRSARRSVPSR